MTANSEETISEISEFKLTNSCPDSLAWNSDLNLLAVGGYNLDDAKNQTKSGEIYFLNEDLKVVKYFDEVGAIFDVEWDGNVLYGCNTIGQIIKIENIVENSTVDKFSITDEDTTLTHIKTDSANHKLAATSNKGDLFYTDLETKTNVATAKVSSKMMNTYYETWCCTFFDENTIFTGSDDSICRRTDVRASDSSSKYLYSATFCERSAGICFVQPSKNSENQIILGGYDSHVCLFDIRDSTKPVLDFELPNDGGAWRVFEDTVHNGYVIAGMYSGLHWFNSDGELDKSYEKYKDGIIYGVEDISSTGEIVYCSFYEKTVGKLKF
jgi:hypothetical protein